MDYGPEDMLVSLNVRQSAALPPSYPFADAFSTEVSPKAG